MHYTTVQYNALQCSAVHAYTRECKHAYIHTYMNACINTCAHIHACIPTRVYTYMQTYTHIRFIDMVKCGAYTCHSRITQTPWTPTRAQLGPTSTHDASRARQQLWLGSAASAASGEEDRPPRSARSTRSSIGSSSSSSSGRGNHSSNCDGWQRQGASE